MIARPGFAFSTRLRVRYAEIDGQKVVFNSRYLEYADVAIDEFWRWSGIAQALGTIWSASEWHVRRAEVDYLKPFAYGDEIEIFVRIDRIGTTSLTTRFELTHAATRALHAAIVMVSVNVDLVTGRPVALTSEVRDRLAAIPA